MNFFRLMLVVAVFGGMAGCRSSHPAAVESATKTTYICPMHPSYKSDRPGECPICHMALVPAKRSPEEEPKGEGDDRAPVFVPATKEQWIGVRTEAVGVRPMEVVVRAPGTVALDQDLYTSLAEHRELVKGLGEARERGDASSVVQSESLVQSSFRRLGQMGLGRREVEAQLEKGIDGLIAGRGPRVVYAQVTQEEAKLVRPGQKAELSAGARGFSFPGRVHSVDRVVDPMTRTVRVRVEISDPQKAPAPETYLDVAIRVECGDKLVAPKEAVIDTGLRRLVYVKTEPGHYAPRTVVLGMEGENEYEILEGLSDGDEVVASAAFLIDSESRLRAVASGGESHEH